jgi:ABC-2 type transport system permease protein
MGAILAIAKREIRHYLITPFAYVFAAVFLLCVNMTFFYLFQFLEAGQSDISEFFYMHPLIYLLFIPSISMRLWSEEFRGGTAELLMTQPVSTFQAVLGKFIAAWFIIGSTLLMTVPVWITVNIYGSPDNGVIFVSYIGSFLIAGAFLAIGSCVSALSGNQVMAFVLAVLVNTIFTIGGLNSASGFIREWLPDITASTLAVLSFNNHYIGLVKGMLDARSIVFFVSSIIFGLFLNVVIVDMKKAD